MSEDQVRKETISGLAQQRLGGPLDRLESPFTVSASPAWRGVEADIWLAQRGEQTRVYKHYHADTAFYVNAQAAMDAAQQTGALGVSPAVMQVWSPVQAMEMQHLGQGWRAGGLHDAYDPAIRQAIVKAKKAIQAGPRFSQDASIFDDIDRLHDHCQRHQVALPMHMGAYLGFAKQAKEAIHSVGLDSVPSHRDGNTSNLMIGDDKSVMLLDFDLAANADPFEDVGCYLMEMFDREPEARAGFEEWHGAFNEALFQRAMTYGVLDDLRWGLIASAMAALSPRKSLEFAKYASWRYLRLELNSQRSQAADRLRRLTQA